MTPVSVTSAGDIYYSLQTKHEQLQRVALGPTGSIEGSAVALAGGEGISRRFPVWSPKGDSLAYLGARGMNLYDFGHYLGLLDADGTAGRRVTPSLIHYGGAPIDWSPDGRSILIRGKGADGFWGYYAIDVESGAATALLTAEPRGEEQNLGGMAMFGDNGRSLIWRKQGIGLLRRDLRSGEQTLLAAESTGGQVTSLSVSPRDQAIAYVTTRQQPSPASMLNVLERDGAIREITERPGAASIIVMQWSADGQTIYFASTGRPQKIWRVPGEGGTPIDLGLTFESARPRVAIRPDGREMIYSTGSTAFETWVMKGIAR